MSLSNISPLSLSTPSSNPSLIFSSFISSKLSIIHPINITTCSSNLKQPCFIKYPNYPLKQRIICRAAEYKFPDPIPEFADSETEKFKSHLVKKLTKRDLYGDSLDEVVSICTEIFSNFLHSEYGGPGTLLVIPFIDMADTLNEHGLPGGPQAARAAVKWAQDNVDKDWNEWTSGNTKS